ncbi:MAG: aminoacyl-tRNA hydrolase [Candidatus Gracilibacteria bacterium]|nr:aminoacyl-tRNA hydrolase [Candidatus Gracilibacteria bacterium]
MKCIVGLGNPGKEYVNTRHNVGFFMVDQIRTSFGFDDWQDSKFHGVIATGMLGQEKAFLLKPTTFMNLSGQGVASLVNFYKLNPKTDILVISDDIDMEFGKVRFRAKGSHGGQNGLRSIIEQLGTDEFARIKIGIGRDERYSVSDWVLSQFQKDEKEVLATEVFSKVESSINEWLGDSM